MTPTPAAPRIALVHALALSVAPVNDAFARDWPQAQRMNLLDDSLSADLSAQGQLDAPMTQRFVNLSDYVFATGADGLLFTCSAFGPCIDAVKQRHPSKLVLKPNEAMVAEASALSRQLGKPVGLIATFALTLTSMPPEFPADVPLRMALADGAMAALAAGDGAAHDAATVAAARRLVDAGCGLIALAQFSLARAAGPVRAAVSVPVLTTVDSAMLAMRRLVSKG
jgi:Asp/Glu/Hydantoin racemase